MLLPDCSGITSGIACWKNYRSLAIVCKLPSSDPPQPSVIWWQVELKDELFLFWNFKIPKAAVVIIVGRYGNKPVWQAVLSLVLWAGDIRNSVTVLI